MMGKKKNKTLFLQEEKKHRDDKEQVVRPLLYSHLSSLQKDWRAEESLRQWPEADSEVAPGSVTTGKRSFLSKIS